MSDNSQISVSASSDTNRVDIIGYYPGYDENGDGQFVDWHRGYFPVGNSGDPMGISDHIGTDVPSPFAPTRNIIWIPDQPAGQTQLIARSKNLKSVRFVTNLVTNLSLNRSTVSVKLAEPQNIPTVYWVRDGQTKGSTVNIPILSQITNARAEIRT